MPVEGESRIFAIIFLIACAGFLILYSISIISFRRGKRGKDIAFNKKPHVQFNNVPNWMVTEIDHQLRNTMKTRQLAQKIIRDRDFKHMEGARKKLIQSMQ
eukprot:m.108878 g.108878  ORF g.108878 m.108878 type:complete len:101 (+) comp9197_c0_seq2:114-416(+)